jgi:hypothetical protein
LRVDPVPRQEGGKVKADRTLGKINLAFLRYVGYDDIEIAKLGDLSKLSARRMKQLVSGKAVEFQNEVKLREQAIFNSTNGRCAVCGKKLSFQNRSRGEPGAWYVRHKQPVSEIASLSSFEPICLDHDLEYQPVTVSELVQIRREETAIDSTR